MKPLRPYLLSITLVASIGLAACGGSDEADSTGDSVSATTAEALWVGRSFRARPAGGRRAIRHDSFVGGAWRSGCTVVGLAPLAQLVRASDS